MEPIYIKNKQLIRSPFNPVPREVHKEYTSVPNRLSDDFPEIRGRSGLINEVVGRTSGAPEGNVGMWR